MAVVTLFRNPHPVLTIREPLDGLAHDLPAESAAMSAETHPSIAIRRAAPILQRLEAGQ
jgi:hypothetical protein